MKKILLAFFVFSLSVLGIGNAQADPTYAVLDNNGNVTNVIVCGSACESGTFGGQKVVLQVAADPVTNENRGGVWQGPGTTKYDSETGIFTMIDSRTEIRTFIPSNNEQSETQNSDTSISSVTIEGAVVISFKYEDTVQSNNLPKNGFLYKENIDSYYLDNTSASLSVTDNNIQEVMIFENRKTKSEVINLVTNSNLLLLNSKINILIDLLDGWSK